MLAKFDGAVAGEGLKVHLVVTATNFASHGLAGHTRAGLNPAGGFNNRTAPLGGVAPAGGRHKRVDDALNSAVIANNSAPLGVGKPGGSEMNVEPAGLVHAGPGLVQNFADRLEAGEVVQNRGNNLAGRVRVAPAPTEAPVAHQLVRVAGVAVVVIVKIIPGGDAPLGANPADLVAVDVGAFKFNTDREMHQLKYGLGGLADLPALAAGRGRARVQHQDEVVRGLGVALGIAGLFGQPFNLGGLAAPANNAGLNFVEGVILCHNLKGLKGLFVVSGSKGTALF